MTPVAQDKAIRSEAGPGKNSFYFIVYIVKIPWFFRLWFTHFRCLGETYFSWMVSCIRQRWINNFQCKFEMISAKTKCYLLEDVDHSWLNHGIEGETRNEDKSNVKRPVDNRPTVSDIQDCNPSVWLNFTLFCLYQVHRAINCTLSDLNCFECWHLLLSPLLVYLLLI